MSRQPRKFSYSQIYHIILKGIDGHDIFYDNNDKNFFLKQILTTKQTFNYIVYSYCLMSNHVHLVIKCKNELLSKAIQSLSIRYVSYFNKKYERTGHLFQGRFKSKSVENQKYFKEDFKKISSINGTNITQIARVIRISRNVIQRLLL